jgi:hypothetical protein
MVYDATLDAEASGAGDAAGLPEDHGAVSIRVLVEAKVRRRREAAACERENRVQGLSRRGGASTTLPTASPPFQPSVLASCMFSMRVCHLGCI